MRTIRSQAVAAVMGATIAAATIGADWPHFRGPAQQGWSPETGIPDTFPAEGLKLLWKAPVTSDVFPPSHKQSGSPVVALGMVFTQSNPSHNNGKHETLYCFDLKDGRQLWTFPTGANRGEANSTPSVNAATGRIFACTSGGTGGYCDKQPVHVHCLDARSGKEIWHMDPQKLGLTASAAGAASPLLFEDTVIITTSRKVFALDQGTGSVKWSWCGDVKYEDRLADPGRLKQEEYDKLDKKGIVYVFATSSPVIGELGGKKVLAQAVRRLADSGYCASTVLLDPGTGRQVGLLPWGGSHQSPVFVENTLVNLVYTGDASYTAYSHPMHLAGFRATWKGEALELQEAWRHKNIANRYHLPSPAVAAGRVYWRSGAHLTCVEAASGKLLWTYSRLGGKAWPMTSPVAADGKVFHVNEEGQLNLLRVQEAEPQLLGTQDLCGSMTASPAIADGRLIVRDGTGVFCYELKPGAPTTTPPAPAAAPAAPARAASAGRGSQPAPAAAARPAGNVEAAPAGDWPQHKRDAARTGNAPAEGLTLPLTRIVAVRLPGPIYASPAVVGRHVFIQDALGNVACIDRSANKAVWLTNIGGVANYSSPAVAGGKVFVGSSAGHLAVLDAADGRLLTKVPAEGGIIAAPAVVKDAVYALSFNADLIKVDLQGKLIWTYDAAQSANEELAVVDGEIVFVAGPADARNKAVPLALFRVRDLGERPELKDRITFIPHAGEWKALAKTDRMKGVYQRARFAEPFVGPTCRGEALFIREMDFLARLDGGKRVWYTGDWPYFNGPRGWRSEPVLARDHLVVGAEDGRVYFYNVTYPPGPGRAFVVKDPLWAFATVGAGQPGGGVCSTPAVAGGAVFFGGEDGVLYGLGKGPEVEVALATRALPPSPQSLPGRRLTGHEWPTSGGDMAYGMVSPDTHVRPPLKIRWKTRILGTGAYNGVTVADGKVFASSANGYLEALDADSGQVVWRYCHPQVHLGPLNDGPATYAEGKVLVLRRAVMNKEILAAAAGLYCHDAETGKLLWHHRQPALCEVAGTPMGVAVWKGKVLGAWHKDKDVVQAAAFDLSTGKEAWTRDFADVLPAEAKGRLYVNQGCLGDGRWYFSASRMGTGGPMKKDAGFGGATLAVDPETGRLLWKDKQHSVVHAAGMNFARGTVFVYETSVATHALEAATGKLLWSTGRGPWYLQPLTDVFLDSQGKNGHKGDYCIDKVYVNGFYYSNVGHSASALVATVGHEGNGKEVWRFCPLSRACPTPAIAYGRLYYSGNGEGVVYCFENAQSK